MHPFLRALSVWALFSALSGCAADEEGCLDIKASNFDAAADINCCCTYPRLKLSMKPVANDTLSFVLGETYAGSADTFAVADVRLLLSDFALIDAGGQRYGIGDSAAFYVLEDDQVLSRTLSDDFLVLARSSFSSDIGSWSHSGAFVALSFRVGLDSRANRIIVDSLAAAHPFRAAGMNDGAGAILFQRASIIPDPAQPDQVLDYAVSGLAQAVPIELSGSFLFDTGYDAELKLAIDFIRLFDGVDFDNDDAATVEAKMVSNVTQIFTLLE